MLVYSFNWTLNPFSVVLLSVRKHLGITVLKVEPLSLDFHFISPWGASKEATAFPLHLQCSSVSKEINLFLRSPPRMASWSVGGRRYTAWQIVHSVLKMQCKSLFNSYLQLRLRGLWSNYWSFMFVKLAGALIPSTRGCYELIIIKTDVSLLKKKKNAERVQSKISNYLWGVP